MCRIFGHIFVNRKTTKMCHHAGEYQYLKQFYKDNEQVDARYLSCCNCQTSDLIKLFN